MFPFGWPLTAPPPGARAGGGGGFVFGIILGALPGAQMDTLDQTQKAQRLHGFRPKVRLRSAPCVRCSSGPLALTGGACGSRPGSTSARP
mgnify:FL=1